MNELDLDVARHRRAAEQLAWETATEQGVPIATRAVAYYGTVAAAMRTHHLTGGGAGRTFTDALMETLIGDPLGVRAATELGPVACLAAEKWIGSIWQWVIDRTAEEPMHPVSAVERAHRRAAVEYALEMAVIDARSITAVAVAVETTTAAKVRWSLGEFDFVGDADPCDLIRDVIISEPLAAAADSELSEDESRIAGGIVLRGWDGIRDRAQNLLTAERCGEAFIV